MATNSWSNRWYEDEDDLVCEYDSTWEETDCHSEGRNSQRNTRYRGRRNRRAAKDMQTYRHRYPEKCQTSYFNSHSDLDQEEMVNLRFYRDEIPSSPDHVKITEFHKHWKGDYERLEWVHSYIQWLFPLQEAGMNYLSKELTKDEIKEFRKDEEAKQRLVTSYELMLDFYGIQLVDKSSGRVARSTNWEERFDNLNRNTHNNLRITRIVKSLGDLGFEHYQAPLVKFFLEETLINDELANVKQSLMDYFLFAVLDKNERRSLIEYAFRHYKPKYEFVWCPKKIQMKLENLDEQDQDKGGQSDVSGCDNKNEANITEDYSKTSKAFQCQALSVDPLQERSSFEQSPPVNREINQPSLPHSASLNGDSPLEGQMQGYSCLTTVSLQLQDLVIQESAQEEGIEVKTESSRVPAEKQSDSDDIKNNSTADDTPAAEQESPLEKQNKNEIVGMTKNPSDSDFAVEAPDPARNNGGPSVSCNPVKVEDVTHEIDSLLSKSSESPTAVGGVKESLNSVGEDKERKGTGSREPACAAENNLRPNKVNESHQTQAKCVESYKIEGGALESPGPKGGVEDSVSLEAAMDLRKPEDAAVVSYLPEGGVRESPRPDVGADEDQRPEGAAEDAASGNDAGNVLSKGSFMLHVRYLYRYGWSLLSVLCVHFVRICARLRYVFVRKGSNNPDYVKASDMIYEDSDQKNEIEEDSESVMEY